MASNKLKTKKEKFILFMSIIFLITSVLTAIKNINTSFKEVKSKQVEENQKQVMEKNKSKIEKTKYILEIADILGEAIGYINDNYNSSNKTQLKAMIQDCIDGLESIQRALQPMYNDLSNKNIKNETDIIKEYFTVLDKAFDNNNKDEFKQILNEKITKEYTKWKGDMEREFKNTIH